MLLLQSSRQQPIRMSRRFPILVSVGLQRKGGDYSTRTQLLRLRRIGF